MIEFSNLWYLNIDAFNLSNKKLKFSQINLDEMAK